MFINRFSRHHSFGQIRRHGKETVLVAQGNLTGIAYAEIP